MQFVCDAPGNKAWFRMETEAEAANEAAAMRHAVDQYFIRARELARAAYKPTDISGIERDIGLKAHIAKAMPIFLTLRADDGEPLATAMLPSESRSSDRGLRIIIVGPANADPYLQHGEAIAALGRHFGLSLDRERCYPYA